MFSSALFLSSSNNPASFLVCHSATAFATAVMQIKTVVVNMENRNGSKTYPLFQPLVLEE